YWSDCGLCFLSSVLTSQMALEQQPGELSVQEGGEVTFQCSINGDDMRKYYMYWYRQGPHGTLEWTYLAYDTHGRSFQDRFKGSVESSKKRFTL
ncbi:HV01 protein, partial [Sapayoa aenigma]|nr:HV01 protein [Sapayoa aenigma]